MTVLHTLLKEYGELEIPGDNHNERILEYFKEIGHKWVKNDETAWCSAVMNWAAKVSGYEYSGKLNARSWLDVGEEITEPELGDVVIFWREKEDSWKGHVGVFIRKKNNIIWVLGGNQGNMLRISAYSKKRVLGYRRLNKIN